MTSSLSPAKRLSIFVSVALTATLVACSDAEAEKPSVASLKTASSAQNGEPAPTAVATGKAAEAALLKYIQCLRKEGLDVSDPSTDAQGNLALGKITEALPDMDLTKLAAAQKVCGNPPSSSLSGIDIYNPQFQDSVVKFTACMRKAGVDVADPDFAKGAAPAMQALATTLSSDDPKIRQGFEQCRLVLAGISLSGNG